MDFDHFRAAVGENLRRARWLAGLTQEQVEGITLRHYQELERGRRNPTLETLLILAQQFDVTVADLVNVRGFRASKTLLTDRKAEPPKVGRKPRGGR